MPAAFALPHACCTSVLPPSLQNQKKAPEIQQVKKVVLQSLHPEQVEVEICRAEELARRGGLTSELEEMWNQLPPAERVV